MAIDPKVFKQVRKALGLSQQKLADALGLSRVTVNKMERGRLRRGIPDEVATRLMFLRAAPKPEANVNHAKELELSIAFQEAGEGDAHLWDNEEDDQ